MNGWIMDALANLTPRSIVREKLAVPPPGGRLATYSLHTHSSYCDGEAAMEDVVLTAIEKGIHHVGFSSHAPLPFETDWTMPPQDLDRYLAEAADLRQRYGDRITIRVGLEVDYVPHPEVADFQAHHVYARALDYRIGSVHFLGDGYPPASFDGSEEEFRRILKQSYGGDMETMSANYYGRVAEMATQRCVDVIGHVDLIKRWNLNEQYFSGAEPWYRRQVEAALAAIAASGRLVELNTSAWRKGLSEPYPSEWILARCRDLDIPIILSADAHAPDQLDFAYERAESLLSRLGIDASLPAFAAKTT